MGNDQFWLRRGDAVYGPYELAELAQFEAARRVGAQDELRREGEEAWRSWADVRAEYALPPPMLAPPTQRTEIHEAPPPERERALEFLLPINRSPLTIIAPYVALFGIAVWLLGPIALALGIMGWRRTKPNQPGKVRAAIAIALGGVETLALVILVVALAASLL